MTFDPRSYGAVVNGVTDDAVALQAAVQAASDAGGGTVGWTGRLFIAAGISWRDGVSLVGSGSGATVLIMGPACTSAIERGFSVGAPGSGITFASFSIDGSQSAVTAAKGLYVTHMERATFYRVVIHDTPATGFGCDFLDSTIFRECIALNCGRLGTTSSVGCAGFGVGTGATAVETCELLDCVAIGNKRYGVFFENQGLGIVSTGAKVTRGVFTGNNRGVGDNGNRGMIVDGARMTGNTLSGFYAGKDQTAQTALSGAVSRCRIEDSPNGVVLADAVDGYRFTDNVFVNCPTASIHAGDATNLTDTRSQVFAAGARAAAVQAAFAIRPPATGLDY